MRRLADRIGYSAKYAYRSRLPGEAPHRHRLDRPASSTPPTATAARTTTAGWPFIADLAEQITDGAPSLAGIMIES
ncbi:hypothetical protein ACQUSR_00285 [Streptomyces sp. P1-3]|uniref:hypothetical protein n=1 Tax=Streptomyces sp. P1-3 TaxID=3421658 RepID=UPI003D3622CC